jgi:hypothetical protein
MTLLIETDWYLYLYLRHLKQEFFTVSHCLHQFQKGRFFTRPFVFGIYISACVLEIGEVEDHPT